jgi:nucleoid DNA-binding protein
MKPEYSQGSTSCCSCFSTKKGIVARNNKSNSREVLSSDQVEWKKNDEILSDMSTFSVKEQEKRLKKALEEEKKVSIEAERVVQWVKQESSKIDSYAIKSILSDNKEKEV